DPGVAQRRLERRVHEPDRGPVTCAQGSPLTHDDPGRQWLGRRDGGLPVDRERGRAVVHDRAVVVGPDVIPIRDLLVEVVLRRRVDIGKVDGDEAIAVLTALLVPQSHGVADLMDGLTEEASPGQMDILPATLLADRCGASGTGGEADD